MTLAADEFIRRFLLHVFTVRFHRIRHYGLLANGSRKASLARVRELLHAVPWPPRKASTAMPIVPARAMLICLIAAPQCFVLETFTRGQTIRAPPRQVHAP